VTPERWQQVTGVFHAALARDTAARGPFLDEACAGDAALRGEVEAMLAGHGAAGRFGEAPIKDVGTMLNLQPGGSLGPYQLDGLLGAGGMGEVYRAHDPRIGRSVAIKILPSEYARDSERLRRFEQESRAIGGLNHPNILTLYDVGTADGMPYLVMELLDGETLRDRLGRGAVNPARACEWTAGVARGLSAAHAKGVVHRDLKPENVMITRDGRVKVLDFGIAKLRTTEVAPDGRTATNPLHTAPHVVLGTAGYMAPEQVRGLPADERADLFAVGVILFELLTGQRAFDRGSQIETLNAILHDDPPPLISSVAPIPPVVERIVQRCLEKDPDARFQSARDLAFALETAPGTGATSTTGARPTVAGRTLRGGLAALLLLATAVAAGLIGWVLKPIPEPAVGPPIKFSIQPPIGASAFAPLAISPDGRAVVYPASGGRTETPRLYLQRLDQFTATALPSTEGGYKPFFSPDGQSVGFAAQGKLKRIGLTGGSAVVLCDVGNGSLGGTWLADDTIIFGSITQGLQRVSANGGAPSPLTTPDKSRSEIDHHVPKILPGGKALLFTIHEGPGRFRIGVQDLSSGKTKVLIDSGFNAELESGGNLVYASGRSLFSVPFDVQRLDIVGTPTKVLDDVATSPDDGDGNFALSAGGTLAYTPDPSRTGRALVWFNRSGQLEPLSTEPRHFISPRLSPDGQRLAVVIVDAERPNIWIHDRLSNTFSQVTFEGANRTPLWTFDGLRLTYSSGRGGRQHLFWQPINLSAPAESLISSKNDLWPGGWTPDGRALVYVEDPPTSNTDIRVLTMNGRSHASANIEIRSTAPVLSPDGRWLAFVAATSGRANINVQPFPGPGLRSQLVEGTEPVWSRDGRELFFRSQRAASTNLHTDQTFGDGIFALPFDRTRGVAAGPPVQIFRGRLPMTAGAARSYDAAPDGQRFVAVLASDDEFAPAHLNIILNLSDQLRRRLPGSR
jgi:serine/threonine-protein kinase